MSVKSGYDDSDGQGNYADEQSGGERNDQAVERWIDGRKDERDSDGEKREHCSDRRAHGLVIR
jgi:hypothetical protein